MTTRGLMALLLCFGMFTFAATAVYTAEKVEDTKLEDLNQQRENALQERVNVAVLCREATQAAYEAETVTLWQLIDAINGEKEAKLAVSKGSERIKVLRSHLEQMQQLELRMKMLVQVGTTGGSAVNYPLAHRERLSAEIELLEEQIKLSGQGQSK